MNDKREAKVRRDTSETKIAVELNVDGTGKAEITTGIGMFDHLLSQLARHGLFDITLDASGDLEVDQHHTMEDVGICLGRAFNEALGQKKGIVRMAHAVVPMDEALAMVAVDISGRGYAAIEAPFDLDKLEGMSTDMISHFLHSFAIEAKLNLYCKLLSGSNDHHKAEALFKALGRALDGATRIDERIRGEVPSTKEFIEG